MLYIGSGHGYINKFMLCTYCAYLVYDRFMYIAIALLTGIHINLVSI